MCMSIHRETNVEELNFDCCMIYEWTIFGTFFTVTSNTYRTTVRLVAIDDHRTDRNVWHVQMFNGRNIIPEGCLNEMHINGSLAKFVDTANGCLQHNGCNNEGSEKYPANRTRFEMFVGIEVTDQCNWLRNMHSFIDLLDKFVTSFVFMKKRHFETTAKKVAHSLNATEHIWLSRADDFFPPNC